MFDNVANYGLARLETNKDRLTSGYQGKTRHRAGTNLHVKTEQSGVKELDFTLS
jgi:hypothetical protein